MNSVINEIMSTVTETKPEVGMGATFLSWTDRHAGTIVIIKSAKRIGVTYDKATRIDNNGMSESQTYIFEPNMNEADAIFFTLRKGTVWVREGESFKSGQRLMVGRRAHYHDFSF